MSIMENMKKVNFAFDGIKQETKEFEMGGITVTAVNKIPYEQKIECAKFIAARRIMEDDMAPGHVVHSINADATDAQAWLMFYTNANVEGMSIDAVRNMYDNLYDDPGYEEMMRFTWDDRDVVYDIVHDFTCAATQRIEEKQKNRFDLSQIMNAFMADLNPDATIQHNRELTEKLIDAMKIVKQGE